MAWNMTGQKLQAGKKVSGSWAEFKSFHTMNDFARSSFSCTVCQRNKREWPVEAI